MGKKEKNKKIENQSVLKNRVLVIDEGTQLFSRLSKLLAGEGFSAEALSKDDKDFEKKLKERFRVILLAGQLEELIEKIRKARGLIQIPIVLVYKSLRDKKAVSKFTGYADDIFILPISQKELGIRLRFVIERQRRTIDAETLKRGYEALERVIGVIREGVDDIKVLQRAVQEIESLIQGVRCSVVMVKELEKKASVLVESKGSGILNIPLELKKYPELQKVIDTRKPISIFDVRRHPVMKEVRSLIADKPLYSVLVTPIFYREELIGLLFIRTVERLHRFSPIEVYFANLVSNTTAVALKNLSLDRLTREREIEREEAIRKAKELGVTSRRLSKLFEHTADGVLLVDQQGKIKGVNQNFLRLSGLSKKEIIGSTIDKFLVLESGVEVNVGKFISKVEKEEKKKWTLQLLGKSGRKFYVSAHFEILPGKKKDCLISLHDITEERKLNLELIQTKEFLERLIQNSMEAIIAADRRGMILVFNKEAERLTGYRAEDVIGKMNIVDLYTPGGARSVMKKLQSPLYGGVGRLETTHSVLVSSDGEEIPVNMSAAIIYDDSGREVATVGLYQDLRERIKIEQELRMAQERLLESQRKEALSALAGAAAHELNQPLTSILGAVSLMEQRLKKISQAPQEQKELDSFQTTFQMISNEAQRMAQIIRKLGEVTEFQTKDYAGKVKILDLEQDRTEKGEKEAEEQILHMERLAGIGRMAAGIAHDLNNPLTVISSCAEILLREAKERGEQKSMERLSQLINATERIQRLIKSLISYARPGYIDKFPIDLKQLLDELLSFSGYELARGGVKIENQIPDDLPNVMGIKEQLEQVFINLLSNASFACAEKGGGVVRIKAFVKDSDWVEVKVEDTGTGIPEENMNRLFEPFFTTKKDGKGTGLGLKIVKDIISQHKGWIEVSSKVGEGSVFTIYLPRAGSSQNK